VHLAGGVAQASGNRGRPARRPELAGLQREVQPLGPEPDAQLVESERQLALRPCASGRQAGRQWRARTRCESMHAMLWRLPSPWQPACMQTQSRTSRLKLTRAGNSML